MDFVLKESSEIEGVVYVEVKYGNSIGWFTFNKYSHIIERHVEHENLLDRIYRGREIDKTAIWVSRNRDKIISEAE